MKSRAFALLLSLALCAALVGAGIPAAGAASGGEEYPFLDEVVPAAGNYVEISTPEQLFAVHNDLDGYYVLTADIDLSGYDDWVPIGATYQDPFTGIFDGQGHVIRNMTITDPAFASGSLAVGLFGYTQDALIRNVGLEGAYIDVSCENYPLAVGGLVGMMRAYEDNNSGGIQSGLHNCYVTGSISVETGLYATNFDPEGYLNPEMYTNVGGLVGHVKNDTAARRGEWTNVIQRSYNLAQVTAVGRNPANAGGLVGIAESGDSGDWMDSNFGILYCANLGEVKATVGNDRGITATAGGLLGQAFYCLAQIQLSCNTGTVAAWNRAIYSSTLDVPTAVYAGGLVGDGIYSAVQMYECYNTGDVSADDERYDGYAGGLLGRSDLLCVVENSYNAGRVRASGGYPDGTSYAGGLIGGGEGSDKYYSTSSSPYVDDTVVRNSFVLTDSVSGATCRSIYGGSSEKTLFTGAVMLDTMPANVECDATGSLTAAQAGQEQTYRDAGWAFGGADAYWKTEPGRDYPALLWEVEIPPAPPVLTGQVEIINLDLPGFDVAPNVGNTLGVDLSGLSTTQGSDRVGEISYQWYVDTSTGFYPLEGETGPTFVIPENYYLGCRVQVRVSAAGCVGRVTSELTEYIERRLELVGQVTLDNTSPQLSDVIHADLSGVYTTQPVEGLTLQWLRNGQVISGATGESYTAGAADVLAALSVRVSAEGAENSLTSAQTAPVEAGTFAQGSGTEDDPYLITGERDWALFNFNLYGRGLEDYSRYRAAHYRMTADVDLSAYPASLNMWEFAGVLDGGGHTLSNTSVKGDGLFDAVLDGGVVKNLRVENVDVTGDAPGGIVGELTGATLENCSFSGNVVRTESQWESYMHAGGLVHTATDAVLSHCYNYGQPGGEFDMGSYAGVVYEAKNCTMTDLINFADLSRPNASQVAGVVGTISGGTLTGGVNYGQLENGRAVGGVAGTVTVGAVLDQCANHGLLTYGSAISNAGGIAVRFSWGTLTNSVNTGDILVERATASVYAGGLAARIGVASGTPSTYPVVVRNFGQSGEISVRLGSRDYYGGGLAGYVDGCTLTVDHIYIATRASFPTGSNREVGWLYGGADTTSYGKPILKFDQATCLVRGDALSFSDSTYQADYYTTHNAPNMRIQEFADELNAALAGTEGLLSWNYSSELFDGYPYLDFQAPRILDVTPEGVYLSWPREVESRERLAAAVYSPEGKMLALGMSDSPSGWQTNPYYVPFAKAVELTSGCTVKVFWLNCAYAEPLGLDPIWPALMEQIP